MPPPCCELVQIEKVTARPTASSTTTDVGSALHGMHGDSVSDVMQGQQRAAERALTDCNRVPTVTLGPCGLLHAVIAGAAGLDERAPIDAAPACASTSSAVRQQPRT